MFKWQEQIFSKLTGADSVSLPEGDGAGCLGIAKAIDYYFESCRHSRVDLLRDKFSVTGKLIGDENFSQLISQFVEKYESKYFSLDDYGKEFPVFLKNNSHPNTWVELAYFELLVEEISQKLTYQKPVELNFEKKLSGVNYSLNQSSLDLVELWNQGSQLTGEFFQIVYYGQDETKIRSIPLWQWRCLTRLLEGAVELTDLLELVTLPEDSQAEVQKFFEFLTYNKLVANS